MLKPIAENVLMQKGNHDGSWGLTPTAYAYNFTPAELYNLVYALTYKYQNAVTDKSGTAYYVDDTARKVRFIMLNTQCNPFEENKDGSAKYNNMAFARFTQVQFDFVTDKALATIPDNDWSVVLCGHHPLWSDETKDAGVMLGVLNAYKNKTTYIGEYAGTATSLKENFTNLFDTNGEGFNDNATQYVENGVVIEGEVSHSFITNKIPVYFNKTTPCVLRIGGVSAEYRGNLTVTIYDANGKNLNTPALVSATADFVLGDDGVYTWNVGQLGDYMSTTKYGATSYLKIGSHNDTLNSLIVTVDEEITYTESEGGGYDAVSVDCDFSNAKGDLVGYFSGHAHVDMAQEQNGFRQVITRCDAQTENDATLRAERLEGTPTEQSLDVFTVNKAERKIYATKIGAGDDRIINY